MSTSTVSLSTNPSPATRRRSSSSAAADVRNSVDILHDATVSPVVDTSINGGNDRNSKDLSDSIRGEAVLERSSKDTKKSQAPSNSNSNLRTRNRKVSAQLKPVKPRWKAVMSVVVKNLLLLIVLLGLVQVVRRFVVDWRNRGELGFSDIEDRIARVESSLKTASKMLQVQVEVVDRKVEGLVNNVRKDVVKRIEERCAEIEARLKELDERGTELEGGWGELRSKGVLTKEDFERVYDEQQRGAGVGLELDAIRALAREVVEGEIEKHAADGVGRVDYALASGGATVVGHSEPLMVWTMGSWFSLSSRNGVHSDADKMLRPSFGEPGQCFPLKGSSGFVEIRLRTAIVPEAITLEHVAMSAAYDRSSAPKQCRVSGWRQGWEGQHVLDPEFTVGNEKILLTQFTYDLEKSNAQTFDVFDSAASAVIDTIRFDFSSNHGSSSHTCIYRLRVHGHETKFT